MVSSCALSIPDITDRWCQDEGRGSKYPDLSNVVHDIFSIILDGVEIGATVSLGPDIICGRLSIPTGNTICKIFIGRQIALANNGILVYDQPALIKLKPENDLETKREAKERQLLRTAKVHDVLEMWQGCPNLPATQN